MGVFNIAVGLASTSRKIRGLLAYGPLLVLYACQIQPEQKSGEEPLLVATTTLAADALRQISWKGAHIEALMGPGTDPHLFKPSLADVRLLAKADLIVAGGLHLEGKMTDVLHQLAEQKPVLFISDSLPKARLRMAPSSEAADPHIWFDVSLWRLGILGTGHRLSILYPEHKTEILERTALFADSLLALHAWVAKKTGVVPASKRILVTSHDAFSYFGQQYGYQIKTLQGISTLSDYGLKDVRSLVGFLVDHNVSIVFPETSMPPQMLAAIQEASAREGHTLRLGKELYTDALDAQGKPAGTYLGMIRYNVELITHGED